MINNFKILALAVLLLTGAAQATAQTAKQVLDKCASVVSNKSGASAKFAIKTPKMGSTSGNISIKGNKFTATTADATMWFNGTTMWTLVKKNNEVNVSNPSKDQLSRLNPYNFINLYKKGYAYSMTKKGGNFEVHLTQAGASVPEMYITINSLYQPTTVRMKDRKGNWTYITISNFKAAKISDSAFTFNSKDYPTAEVIDLR